MIILTAPVLPSVPVGQFANELLTTLQPMIVALFPWAAAVTGFVIGVGLVLRWLGFSNFMTNRDKYGALGRGPTGYYGKGEDRIATYQGSKGRIYTSRDYDDD